jgi:hypothetical protein
LPSGKTATPMVCGVCCSPSTKVCSPLTTSHSRTVLSEPQLTTRRPSGNTAAANTPLVCPSRMQSTTAVRASHAQRAVVAPRHDEAALWVERDAFDNVCVSLEGEKGHDRWPAGCGGCAPKDFSLLFEFLFGCTERNTVVLWWVMNCRGVPFNAKAREVERSSPKLDFFTSTPGLERKNGSKIITPCETLPLSGQAELPISNIPNQVQTKRNETG